MKRAPGGADEPSPPESARQLALSVVADVVGGSYLSRSLSDALDASELVGQDRSLAADLSYGAVRWLPSLDRRLAPYLDDPGRLPTLVLTGLRLGAYELLHRGTPAYAAVDAWVEVVKSRSPKHAALANAVLRRLAREDDVERELDLALPDWLFAEMSRALGQEHAVAAAKGMLEPEPLWLTAFSDSAIPALEADGCEVTPGPALPLPAPPEADPPRSFAVRCPLPVSRLRAFRNGLVQPQNPSSLYAALALGARPGELVYDLAAGQGIKSATLAKLGARVVAVELSERRSRSAERNLRRLGVSVEHVVADVAAGWPKEGDQAARHVLLDAPCSGTGTLRGHPEIKLRLEAAYLAGLADLQGRLLAAAARSVAPGGTLLYAVCSVTAMEGVDVVDRFLGTAPAFEPLPWPEHRLLVPVGPGVYVLPVEGLDGFYLARLRRDGRQG